MKSGNRKWTCIISLFIFVCIVTCFVIAVSSNKAGITRKVDLESLSNEECIAFLEENGVHVPEFYVNAGGDYVKDIVKVFIDDPNYTFAVGLAEAQTFYDGVKAVVNRYD